MEVFTPQATVHLAGSILRGLREIDAAYRPSFASPRKTKHLVTNVQVVQAGTKMAVTSYLLGVGLKGAELTMSWGSYACSLVKTERTWLIDELRIGLDVPFLPLALKA